MPAWRFAYIPQELSAEIKKKISAVKKGWASLPVTAKLGVSTWKSSIFPDSKSSTYVLPLKLQLRKKEKINDGDTVRITVRLRV
ncbi:DUF1905 domain-containing protein [Candidatus Uhrbacteria bacterium]|nr:DUF1905 domain-containing protein [Candidatus Uhrbacteria bacterium]